MQASTSAAGEPALHGRVSISARAAGPSDVAALARLINRAYAIEAAFVDGDRTSEPELVDLDQRGDFLVIDRVGGGLAAAVYVRANQADGARGYLGMLSVDPDLQGLGLGRRLVALAEALCAARGCTAMDLQIINLREELGSWYRSLGYHEVGTAPYTHRDAKRPLHFVKMSKALTGPG